MTCLPCAAANPPTEAHVANQVCWSSLPSSQGQGQGVRLVKCIASTRDGALHYISTRKSGRTELVRDRFLHFILVCFDYSFLYSATLFQGREPIFSGIIYLVKRNKIDF